MPEIYHIDPNIVKLNPPNINVRLDGNSMVAFLDTGSSISAINPKTASLIGSDEVLNPITMRSASGTFSVTHAVAATVDFGDGEKSHTFFVIPTLVKGVLLGSDFLAGANISVHPGLNSARVGEKFLPFVKSNGQPLDVLSLDLHLMEHVEYIKENYPIDFSMKNEFYALLEEFADVFDDKPSVAKVKPMRINTGDKNPIKQAFRPLNPGKQKIATEYTQEMIDLGVYEDCDGPWASNYVFVDKPDGSKRLCGDYRQVNDITVSDAFPMPIVRDILVRMAKSKIFSSFDLTKGFYQIPVHEEDRPKTAVFTPLGLKQCRTIPFGLKNAPAVFQRVMEEVLGDILYKFCLVYIDDVVIFSETEEQHIEYTRAFLTKMRKYNLRINPKKIQPFQRSIKILGHIVTEGSYAPDPEKIEGIQKCPLPKTVKQLQSFLGSVSYYRTFIEGLAHIAKPLYAMTSVHSPRVIAWNSMQIEAFNECKKAIVGLILHMPDLNGKFCIQTDASGLGIGAVLLTRTKKGDKSLKIKSTYEPCAFISRNLTDAEQNYSVTDQECLAVVWAVEKFRPFVECRKFKILTDHKALTWLRALKDPKGRLSRWVMRLQGFDYKIGYRPGSLNVVPDCLSRNPVTKDDSAFLPEIFGIFALEEEVITNQFPIFEEYTRKSIVEAQKADDFINSVRKYVLQETLEKDLPVKSKAKIITAAKDAFVMEDGLVVRYTNPFNYASFEDEYNYERILAPEKLKEPLLRRYHDDPVAGHLGIDRTYDSIQKRFYWPSMFSTVRDYVKSCHTCQTCRSNNAKPLGLMKPSEITFPWEKVSIDLIGPLPKTKNGNEYILVIIDTASGWPEAFPVRQTSATAEGVASLTLAVFCHWGFPNRIVSDNGPQFASLLWVTVMQLLKIKTIFTTPYHPQANPVERRNKDCKAFLRKYVDSNHKSWDQYLHLMLFALRSAKNKSTGLTPAQVCLGRKLTSPLDLFLPDSDFKIRDVETISGYANKIENQIKSAVKLLVENRELAHIENKLYYDPNHKSCEFNEGDLVTVEAHPYSSREKGFMAALAPKRRGPLIVRRKLNYLNYELGDMHADKPECITHTVQMKKYYQRPEQPILQNDVLPKVPSVKKKTDAPVAAVTPVTDPPRFGLGRKRGRPKGPATVVVPVVPEVREDGPMTRQQKKLLEQEKEKKK
jgi:hypothetical protein